MEVTEQKDVSTASDALDESTVQRELERAKEHVVLGRLLEAFVLEFTIAEMDGTQLLLECDEIEITVELYDWYGLDGALRRSIEYQPSQKVYIPLLTLSYAGKQRSFAAGVYESESDAEDALPRGSETRSELPFRFRSNTSEQLVYGPFTTLRHLLPDRVESCVRRPLLLCGLLALSPITAVATHQFLYFLPALAAFLGVFALEHFRTRASVVEQLSLDDVYEQSSGDREYDVVTCDFESTSSQLVIRSPQHDAEWTFSKNSMGELEQRGKEALEAVSVEGRECIACVSRTRVNEVNRLESDCGKWKIERL